MGAKITPFLFISELPQVFYYSKVKLIGSWDGTGGFIGEAQDSMVSLCYLLFVVQPGTCAKLLDCTALRMTVKQSIISCKWSSV